MGQRRLVACVLKVLPKPLLENDSQSNRLADHDSTGNGEAHASCDSDRVPNGDPDAKCSHYSEPDAHTVTITNSSSRVNRYASPGCYLVPASF